MTDNPTPDPVTMPDLEYRATDASHPVSAVFVRPHPRNWFMIIKIRGSFGCDTYLSHANALELLDLLIPADKRQLYVDGTPAIRLPDFLERVS